MKLFAFLILLLCSYCSIAQKNKPLYNLDSAKDNIDAYIKMRASLIPTEDVVFYATGSIYGYEPEKPWKKLFNFEMYNIARVEKMGNDSGYRLITREMLVYQDPKTNQILTTWLNPYTLETVNVIPVWNDPVNQTFTYNGGFKCPYKRLGNGRINLYNDVTLSYPSPLKKAEFPLNSRSDVYQGAEMFNFFCNEADIQNKNINNVNVDISWSRFSDFLPWMRMSSLPGNLLYQSRGWKIKGGFKGLPKNIKDYVMANKPEYALSPGVFKVPNMTSWKYFKELMRK